MKRTEGPAAGPVPGDRPPDKATEERKGGAGRSIGERPETVVMSEYSTLADSAICAAPTAARDLDLLAAMIVEGTGSVASARTEARRLIRLFGDLAGVAAADEVLLLKAGVSASSAAQLRRARDLAEAMARAEACRRPVLSSWTALTAYLRTALAHAPREQFRVLYLDKRNILMREEMRADGTVDHAPVYNAGPARVARLGRVPSIPETEHYVAAVLDCFLALTAGRRVTSARQCREGSPVR